jgi:peptide-methionine (S)-S-oxide reductase
MTGGDSYTGMTSRTETATFAAGCFWGVEAAFLKVKGVLSTQVGYTGGTTLHPDYHDVCTGRTGHAEAVEIIFDPGMVSYQDLLDVFWSIHDPTQLNRQGLDIGTNYRSAIFTHSEEQRVAAETSKKKLQESGRFGRRNIVTEIVLAPVFWPAEEYHQQYFEKTGQRGCHL